MTATGRATLLLLCALTAATAVLNPTVPLPWTEVALNNQQASQVIPSLSALTPPAGQPEQQPTLLTQLADATLQLLQQDNSVYQVRAHAN
jgi:poly-beta-hydroxyalkanoate depolymerase